MILLKYLNCPRIQQLKNVLEPGLLRERAKKKHVAQSASGMALQKQSSASFYICRAPRTEEHCTTIRRCSSKTGKHNLKGANGTDQIKVFWRQGLVQDSPHLEIMSIRLMMAAVFVEWALAAPSQFFHNFAPLLKSSKENRSALKL